MRFNAGRGVSSLQAAVLPNVPSLATPVLPPPPSPASPECYPAEDPARCDPQGEEGSPRGTEAHWGCDWGSLRLTWGHCARLFVTGCG